MNTPHRFEIKQELLPTRCDVCHQADLFDPKTGMCERCHGVLPSEPDPQSGLLVYQRPIGLNWRITEIMTNAPPLPFRSLAQALVRAPRLLGPVFFPVVCVEMVVRWLTIKCIDFPLTSLMGNELSLIVILGLILVCLVLSPLQTIALTLATADTQQDEPRQLRTIYSRIWERGSSLISALIVMGSYRLLIGIWGMLFLLPIAAAHDGIPIPLLFLLVSFLSLVPPLYAFGSSSFVMEFLLLDRFNQDPLISSQTYFGRNWRMLSVYWLIRWVTIFGTASVLAVLLYQLGYAFIWFWMVMFPLHSLLTAFFTITKTLLFTEIESDVRRRLNEALPVTPNPSEQ
ncbi:MAG TPA: C1 domain-containing protein [Acidobacteriota bacterium]|nr:C1 domain-containing protein [Acidobacteriota bacterium]